MHPIKILALDLDGTLVVQGNEVSDETRNALSKLPQQGVEPIIATGRRYRTTRYVIDNLGFPVHAVCNGGALIKHRDQTTLQQTCIGTTNFPEIVQLARNNGLTLIAQRDSHSIGGADFIIDCGVHWNKPTRSYYEDNQAFAVKKDLLDETTTDEYLVMGAFGEQHALQSFCQQLNQGFPEQYHNVTFAFNTLHTWYTEITQAHVTKWSGLSFLADLIGVTHHSICAVGDELNDLTMIKHAGIGVAMGNAKPELQRQADWICGNHDDNGLLKVIDYIKAYNGKLQ